MLRYCFSCRRLIAVDPDAKFCPCGKSWSGRRCLSCLALSDSSAIRCTTCGKGGEQLSEPAKSLNLTWVSRLFAIALIVVTLKLGVPHLPLLFGLGTNGITWMLGTTPLGLFAPIIGAVKVLLILLFLSLFLPANARNTLWRWFFVGLTLLWKGIVVMGRLAVRLGTFLLGNRPEERSRRKRRDGQ